ncbi:hypothetical protein GCM10022225_79110 [Plantactinospora mayteni]|uniref:Pyrrolo-quinoline quinone repeat domain-containing protein n=1 Tax=Plantactinospora mayteni TaxID=566021 RepID=A0ABQ4F2W2_9ACTN|nr:PQQ-binding-like beta-propeller repeat protein [Plantactinospora mayteni]GIH01239.1 hypothetical protein Pma05_78110 [Plantactinospora mayteni]
MAVIDLGEERYDPPANPVRPRRSRRRRLRTTALLLAGALVLGAGGAAPPAAPLLTELYRGVLPADSHFTLTGDRLFVSEPVSGGARRVSAYELGRGRQVWSSTYRTEYRQVGLAQEGGLLVVVEGRSEIGPFRTQVLDAGTGRLRWSVPAYLTVVPEERTALIVETVFPPGSRIDPNDPPAAGTTYYASRDGGTYSTPPLGETGRVIDLDTGRELWTLPLLADISTVPAAAGRPAALLAGGRDGRLELRDLKTGAVRQRLDSAAGPLQYAEEVAGDSLMVRFESYLAVYSADLRQRRWIRAMPAGQEFVNPCGPMLCLEDPTGVEVIDRVTGRTAWRSAERVRLAPHGPHLVETVERATVRRAVDPGTGRTVLDLTGWTAVAPSAEAGPMLLRRRIGSDGRTWLGLLDPEGTLVRPLDRLPFGLSRCQMATGLIACRTDLDELRAWRYRQGATPAG